MPDREPFRAMEFLHDTAGLPPAAVGAWARILFHLAQAPRMGEDTQDIEVWAGRIGVDKITANHLLTLLGGVCKTIVSAWRKDNVRLVSTRLVAKRKALELNRLYQQEYRIRHARKGKISHRRKISGGARPRRRQTAVVTSVSLSSVLSKQAKTSSASATDVCKQPAGARAPPEPACFANDVQTVLKRLGRQLEAEWKATRADATFLLVAAGFDGPLALQLANRHPPDVVRAACVKAMSAKKNPAGMVRRILEGRRR